MKAQPQTVATLVIVGTLLLAFVLAWLDVRR